MSDTKLKSISESLLNIACGFPINYVVNLAVLPFFALEYVSGDWGRIAAASAWIGLIFTVIAIVRSYLLRRLFNKFDTQANLYNLLRKGITYLKYAPKT